MTLHVYPVADVIEHNTEQSNDCLCSPKMQFYDPETGKVYAEPLVIHNSFDGREHLEASDA